MQHKEVSELASILRKDGDQILDASSKLSLSATLLAKINESMHTITENFLDLQLLYDFIQKTLGLKIFAESQQDVKLELLDLGHFRNLRLLEVHRLSFNLLKGLKHLRSQLEYVTCMRSVTTLKDVLENCGGDRTQGYVWCELKEAIFSHNNLHVVDASLEFAPWLQTLDLSYNYITNIEALNCLTNLKYLNLANNKIEAIPCFSGPICSNLKVLILRNNYLENIREIEALINLSELDLSNNCLLEFDYLLPLANLRLLHSLRLQDNPLNYDLNYRVTASRYLNVNISSNNFSLDGLKLNKRELRVVGSVRPSMSFVERYESFNSTTTASTVVNLKKDVNQTSDMEVSCSSIEVSKQIKPERKPARFLELGMQDSGIVAGPRPQSPSDSIDPVHNDNNPQCSASSLQSDDRQEPHILRYSESDIEILSNPSQSSIEVLSTPRCVQSCIVIPYVIKEMCLDSDLKKISEELHRSL